MAAPPAVQELARRFQEHRTTYRAAPYNEAQVRVEFIDPLFRALGWDVGNTKGLSLTYREVVYEDVLTTGTSVAAPDYSFRFGGDRKFFVEAKRPLVNLATDPAPAYQLRRYAWSAKLPISVLTDFEEFAIYDCREEPRAIDDAAVARILYFEFDEWDARWDFYAMYIMSSTRCGVSAKQLERELGVTYKTAWRMFNLIRNQLMADNGAPLRGEVEADETLMGGKMRNSHRREREALGWDRKRYDNEKKTMVFAAVERDGRVRAHVIPNSSGPTLRANVTKNVEPGSILYTDEWGGYKNLRDTYEHRTIRHADRIYVDGTTHTQTVEGFFSLIKNAIRGVHHGVSDKWLQGYLNEYAWRYNRRGRQNTMFLDLLDEAANKPLL